MKAPSPPPLGFADALFGKARRGVLALLFGRPGKAYYTREIVKWIGAGASQVQKELELLTNAGLLLREERANQVYYRANPAATIYSELVALVTKSFGVADVVREALDKFSDRIDFACIYGSVARGEQRADSDLDLLIVGSLRLSELSLALQSAETKLNCRISPSLIGKTEFMQRIDEGDPFLSKIMSGQTIPLLGEVPVKTANNDLDTR